MFMRRFIALIISFFVFFSSISSHASAEIVPLMSEDSKAYVNVSFTRINNNKSPSQNNTTSCHYNEKATSFCLGVIKFELKNHQNLMPSVKFNIRPSSPNTLQILWGKTKAMFSWKTLLEILVGGMFGGADLRKNILGASGGAALGFFTADSGYSNLNKFKLNINNIPIEYRLVPISSQEAGTLTRNLVNAGAKKKSLKDVEDFYNNIDAANGKTDAEKLAEGLLKKAIDVMGKSNVDPGDPFNAVQTGNVLKYDGYRSPKNLDNYISPDEAKKINAQISKSRTLICDKYSNANGINSSNFNDGNIAVLSKANPSQCFAVIVNNVDKPEALKLKLLSERLLANKPVEGTSNLLFETQIAYDSYDWPEESGEDIIDLAVVGPSWPARIIKSCLPNGISQHWAGAVDYVWKFIKRTALKGWSIVKGQKNKINMELGLSPSTVGGQEDHWYTRCLVTVQNGAKTIAYHVWVPIRSLGEWLTNKISGYFNFDVPFNFDDDFHEKSPDTTYAIITENAGGNKSKLKIDGQTDFEILGNESPQQQTDTNPSTTPLTTQQQQPSQNPYNVGDNQYYDYYMRQQNQQQPEASTQDQTQQQQTDANPSTTPQQQPQQNPYAGGNQCLNDSIDETTYSQEYRDYYNDEDYALGRRNPFDD